MQNGASARSRSVAGNLILTGFMGTGKTSTGQEIARRLGAPFIDMDALIENREGMAVAEIFRQRDGIWVAVSWVFCSGALDETVNGRR